MPPARTQRLWRALGFPDAADDDPRLHRRRRRGAERAVDAHRLRLRRPGHRGLDRAGDGAVAVPARRLADRHAGRRPDAGRAGRSAGRRRRRTRSRRRGLLLPRLRHVQDYVWRRHLAANADRLLAATGPGDRRELAVGFADLVGYTSRSRGMGGRELGAMVEDFEAIATEVIARHHGRVVKTVGDGVLFTAASAVDAVEIGLQLPEAWDTEERPPLRVGAAYGARADPPRRHLLAGGQPGQPADVAGPPGDDARRPGARPAAARPARLPGAAAAAGVGARLRPPAAVAGAPAAGRARTTTPSRACSTSWPTTSSTSPRTTTRPRTTIGRRPMTTAPDDGRVPVCTTPTLTVSPGDPARRRGTRGRCSPPSR